MRGCHRQTDEHWNCFKGNIGETSDRLGGVHKLWVFPSPQIPSWTELNWCLTVPGDHAYLQFTATQELVRTMRLTVLVATQAFSTLCVPSTAGWITSFSSFGWLDGNGLATWMTYVTPLTALKTQKIKQVFLIIIIRRRKRRKRKRRRCIRRSRRRRKERRKKKKQKEKKEGRTTTKLRFLSTSIIFDSSFHELPSSPLVQPQVGVPHAALAGAAIGNTPKALLQVPEGQWCCGLPRLPHTHQWHWLCSSDAFCDTNEPWPTTSNLSSQPCPITLLMLWCCMARTVACFKDLSWIVTGTPFQIQDPGKWGSGIYQHPLSLVWNSQLSVIINWLT